MVFSVLLSLPFGVLILICMKSPLLSVCSRSHCPSVFISFVRSSCFLCLPVLYRDSLCVFMDWILLTADTTRTGYLNKSSFLSTIEVYQYSSIVSFCRSTSINIAWPVSFLLQTSVNTALVHFSLCSWALNLVVSCSPLVLCHSFDCYFDHQFCIVDIICSSKSIVCP